MGPKGKTPWITLNGEEIADSQLCLELLARKFHKDCTTHLSSEDQTIVVSNRNSSFTLRCSSIYTAAVNYLKLSE